MLRKLKKLWVVLKYFFTDEDNLLLHLIELKAYESLNDCLVLEVSSTEEIEDLLFHIRLYYDIPDNLVETKYPQFKGLSLGKAIKSYKENKMNINDLEEFADFMVEVETERAVERDIILEQAKCLSFGFRL